jgi:hypothetical protein
VPKPKHIITNTLLRGLKWYLDIKVGFTISNQLDCRKVVELIQIEIGSSISESTLYRLFLWQNNQNSPYLHTLEILAKFIGYLSWRDLEKDILELISYQFNYGALEEENNYSSLLKICIHFNTLKPLYNFLEQFSEQIHINKKFLLGQEIFQSLKSNPNKNLLFFKNFQNLPIVRSSLFEIMADPEFSVPHYEQGLKYYLGTLKPHQSTKALQDFVFAHTLLLRYYFVMSKKSKVLKTGKLLYNDLEISNEEIETIFIFPKIRFFTYKLFYHFMLSGFDMEYWRWLREEAISLAVNAPFEYQRIIIHTILDTLQINPSLQTLTYDEFSLLFPAIFDKLPDYVKHLPINKKIKFLDPNASTSYTKNLFF